MRNRKLSLKRESLAELTSVELVNVAGGAQEISHLCNPTDRCGHGPSFDERCPTLPLYYCFKVAEPASLLDCIATS